MNNILKVGLAAFLIDQASKYLVVHMLNLKENLAIDVLPPVFNLRMAWNTGVNFGLFSESSDAMRWILIAVALGISLAVYSWVKQNPAGRWQEISAGLLIGGAIGNVVDRVLYGAVADFINISCCGIHNPFAFNVADISIFAGAFGLILFTPSKNVA